MLHINLPSPGEVTRLATTRADACVSIYLKTTPVTQEAHSLLEEGITGMKIWPFDAAAEKTRGQYISPEDLAEAPHLPVAPHDCTGPVVLCASTHLSLNAPNALVQESVRAFYRTWYRDLVTALPEVKQGMITVPPGPGLGMELDPEIDRAYTVSRKRSDATDI